MPYAAYKSNIKLKVNLTCSGEEVCISIGGESSVEKKQKGKVQNFKYNI